MHRMTGKRERQIENWGGMGGMLHQTLINAIHVQLQIGHMCLSPTPSKQ